MNGRYMVLCFFFTFVISLSGCTPEIAEMDYKPYRDPFDTTKRISRAWKVPDSLTERFVDLLGRSSLREVPGPGSYTLDFVPIGTISIQESLSRSWKCQCDKKRLVCGSQEFVLKKSDLSAYHRVIEQIDSGARSGGDGQGNNPT